MICEEIISVYCESHSKHANTPYGQNGELPNTSLLVLGDPSRLDTNLGSYCGNNATRAGKAQSCT